MKIYTKKGDRGETYTLGGRKVLKCDFNIASVGDVDELNAFLGMIKTSEVTKIQEDLFLIGAVISGGKGSSEKLKKLHERVVWMEGEIDRMWGEMPKLTNFIFFGGTETASRLYVARAIARRAERSIVALASKDLGGVVIYMNRLSDYLFCLGRWVNFRSGIKERAWIE